MSNILSTSTTIINNLKLLGIYTGLCEDPAQLLNKMDELKSEFLKELKDKIENLSGHMDVQKVVWLLADVLSSAVGGIAADWYDVIINDFFNGKLKGGIATLISTLLNAVPGAILVVQYGAVVSLRQSLVYRKTLIKILQQNIDLISSVLLSYLTLFRDIDITNKSLDRSITELSQAIKILALDVDKYELGGLAISEATFKKVNTHLEKSIDFLSSDGVYLTSNNILTQIQLRYNLKTTPPTLVDQINPVYWITYFYDLNKEILDTFSSNDAKQILADLALSLFPFLPRLIQLILIQTKVMTAIDIIQQKTPTLLSTIDTNINLNFLGVKINNTGVDFTSELYDSVAKFFGYSNSKQYTPEFFQNKDTKDLTIQSLNSNIKTTENIVLSITPLWELIKEASSIYNNIAKDSLKNLIKIRTDMIDKNIRLLDNNLTESEYTIFKLQTLLRLTNAKGNLSTAVGKYNGLQVPGSKNITAISGLQLSELLYNSNIAYENLKSYIMSKTVDEYLNPVIEPIDVAYNLSQVAIIKLISNIGIIAIPEAARNLIAELKSASFTYSKQLKMDTFEIELCNQYISILEGSTLFKNINDTLNYYLNDLKNIPTISNMVNDILSGDISGIITEIGDTNTIYESIKNCSGLELSMDSILKTIDNESGNLFSTMNKHFIDYLQSIKCEYINSLKWFSEFATITKSLNDETQQLDIIDKIDIYKIPEEANSLIPFM